MSGIINSTGARSGIIGVEEVTTGQVINTYHAKKLGTQTISSVLTGEPVTGLLIENITPKNDSSEFLVRFDVTYWGNDIGFQIEIKIASGSWGSVHPPTGLSGSRWGTHTGGSHRVTYDLNAASMTILHAPATASDIHYRVTCTNCPGTGPTGYVNRAQTMGTGSNDEQGISTITVQEIAG